MHKIHCTFKNEHVTIHQYKYPYGIYKAEVRCHETAIHEYADEIVHTMRAASDAAKPNVKLIANQPYINSVVRYKLVDFLMKMSVRLKILPFVFCRAVRFFDRYCSKRVVLLDQAQLIITTCLWIAAKVQGGNNHFANFSSDRHDAAVRTISDLGYGGGARFQDPTERYRLPKLREMIKLCGSRCNYDAKMFNQMEMHIMSALDWKLNDPSIDEYMVVAQELKITVDSALETKLIEFFHIKRFMAYAACYSYDLIKYDVLEVAKVIVDLINNTLSLHESDSRFQTLNHSIILDEQVVDYSNYEEIKRCLTEAIANAPVYLLQYFNTRGPQSMVSLLSNSNYKAPTPDATLYAKTMETYDKSKAEYKAENNAEYKAEYKDYKTEYKTEYKNDYKDYKDYKNDYPKSSSESAAKSVFSDYPASNYTYGTFEVNATPKNHNYTRTVPKFPDPPPSHLGRKFETGKGVLDPAHSHSHHYPPLTHPTCVFYSRSNGSHSSIKSSTSSKEIDIFDHDRPSIGLQSPSSETGDIKVQEKNRRF